MALSSMRKQSGLALLMAMLVVVIATTIAVNIVYEEKFTIRKSAHIQRNDRAALYAVGLEDWARIYLRQDREDSVVSWVIQEGCSYRGRLKDNQGNRPLRDLLDDEVEGEVILIPVIVDREVRAVLYGDNGADDGEIGSTGDLERVIARVAREMDEKRHE